MDADRTAAKRRASFGRADRLAKEARQKTEQARVERSRKAERDKADRQRKDEAVKAAEHRNAQARKRAEQRRLARRAETMRQGFARAAANRRAESDRTERGRAAERFKTAAERDPRRREAAAYVAQQERRQLRDQQEEHRRQTHRLRVAHQGEHAGFRSREAAGIVNHARQVRNIDIAERRALEALGTRQRSLTGRAVSLVRGAQHYGRQERAIVDRHETDRWKAHRDQEARKDALFTAEQAARLRRVSERYGIAKTHQAERRDLCQAHERDRPRLIEVRVQAMARANDNERARQREEHVRPTQAFGQAAGRNQEIKRS